MITQRILQIIDYKNISKSAFYKETGLSNGFLDKVKDIGASKVEKILSSFPEISCIWLITGKGEMLNESTTTVEKSSPENDFVLKPIDDSLGIDPSNMTKLEYYMAVHNVQSEMIDKYKQELQNMYVSGSKSVDNVNRLLKMVEKLKKENEDLRDMN